VTVSPDFADNTKFADEWLPAQAGTDAALAMAMGHVILKEFFVDRLVPFFTDYVKTYTDLPFLITLTENAEHGGLVPGKFLTELDLETRSELVEALLDRPRAQVPARGGVEDGAAGCWKRQAGDSQRFDGLPLRQLRRWSLEPRPGRHHPRSVDPRRRRRRGRGGTASSLPGGGRIGVCAAAGRSGCQDRRSPRDHGLRSAACPAWSCAA
jgi:hypothetical protein